MEYLRIMIQTNQGVWELKTPNNPNEVPEVKEARIKAFRKIVHFLGYSNYSRASILEKTANALLQLVVDPILSSLNEMHMEDLDRVIPIDPELLKIFNNSRPEPVSVDYISKCIEDKTNLFLIEKIDSSDSNIVEIVPTAVIPEESVIVLNLNHRTNKNHVHCLNKLNNNPPKGTNNSKKLCVLFQEGSELTFAYISECFSSREDALGNSRS